MRTSIVTSNCFRRSLESNKPFGNLVERSLLFILTASESSNTFAQDDASIPQSGQRQRGQLHRRNNATRPDYQER